MSHTINVTGVPDETRDDYTWTVDGTCDSRCEVWFECSKTWHRHPKNDDLVGTEWGNKRVGEHQWIDGAWSVPSTACGYTYADTGQLHFDLVDDHATLGDTYAIEIEWDGDWYVSLLTNTALAAGTPA